MLENVRIPHIVVRGNNTLRYTMNENYREGQMYRLSQHVPIIHALSHFDLKTITGNSQTNLVRITSNYIDCIS